MSEYEFEDPLLGLQQEMEEINAMEEEEAHSAEPRAKKRKVGDISVSIHDNMSSMAQLLARLSQRMDSIEKENKKELAQTSLDDRIALSVAANQFRLPGFEKQFALNTKLILKLKDAKSAKIECKDEMIDDVIKDLSNRNALLKLADKHPKVLNAMDAQEQTKELEDLSKDFSKDIRELIMKENAAKKQRFQSAGGAFGRNFIGSSHGRFQTMFNQSQPQKIPSLLELPRIAGACFNCQQVGHIQRNCPLKKQQGRRFRY